MHCTCSTCKMYFVFQFEKALIAKRLFRFCAHFGRKCPFPGLARLFFRVLKMKRPVESSHQTQWWEKSVSHKHCTCSHMRAGEIQEEQIGSGEGVSQLSIAGNSPSSGMHASGSVRILCEANASGTRYALACHADWEHT